LFDADRVSAYDVSDGPLDGVFTSRADLADCLLNQVSDDRFVGKAKRGECVTKENRVPIFPRESILPQFHTS